jgi:hypothetical protein
MTVYRKGMVVLTLFIEIDKAIGKFPAIEKLDRALKTTFELNWSSFYLHGHHWFQNWLENHQIPLTHCHTSGHAPVDDLRRLADAIAAKRLVPIHSFEPNAYKQLFQNFEIRNDGETWAA